MVLPHAYATAFELVNAEDICDAGGSLEALGWKHVADAAGNLVKTLLVPSPDDTDADILRKGEALTYASSRIKR